MSSACFRIRRGGIADGQLALVLQGASIGRRAHAGATVDVEGPLWRPSFRLALIRGAQEGGVGAALAVLKRSLASIVSPPPPPPSCAALLAEAAGYVPGDRGMTKAAH